VRFYLQLAMSLFLIAISLAPANAATAAPSEDAVKTHCMASALYQLLLTRINESDRSRLPALKVDSFPTWTNRTFDNVLQRHTFSDLARVVTDTEFAKAIIPSKTPPTEEQIEEFQFRAAQYLVELPGFQPKEGQILSDEDLRAHAALFGKDIKQYDELYRIDNRSPAQISETKGFLPNPSKPPGNAVAHVEQKSLGTGSFVSATTKTRNLGLLEITKSYGDTFKATPIKGFLSSEDIGAYKNLFHGQDVLPIVEKKLNWILRGIRNGGASEPSPLIKDQISFIIAAKSASKPRTPTSISVLYEYKLKSLNGIGVKNPKMKAESEILLSKVSLSQVDQWRPIYVLTFDPPLEPEQQRSMDRLSSTSEGFFWGGWRNYQH
jgi:hypothetical protein